MLATTGASAIVVSAELEMKVAELGLEVSQRVLRFVTERSWSPMTYESIRCTLHYAVIQQFPPPCNTEEISMKSGISFPLTRR